MIIDIWMKKLYNNEWVYSEIVNTKEVIQNKTTGYKIRYTCDCKDCRNSNKVHTTTSSTLLRNGWNNYNEQMCRSCRSVKSERIKGTIKPFKDIKKSVESEGYKMLSLGLNYESSKQPSQYKLKVSCNKDHIYNITWNNWSKGKRCKKCYEITKKEQALKYSKKFQIYRYYVLKETKRSYRIYQKIINPLNLKRGKFTYHLDHRFSIVEGFNNNIMPNIIGSHYNLEMLPMKENECKGMNCSITKEELFNEYFGTT